MSKWIGVFDVIHLTPPDQAGWRKEIWKENAHNNLSDEGEYMVLDSFLRDQGHPAEFHLRMFNDVAVDTDALSSLTGEPGAGSGYSSQLVLRSANASGWPTLTNDGGDWMAISRQVTFDCTSPYTSQQVILATTSSNAGKLVSYASLSQARMLASGEQLRVTFRPKLS